MRLLRLLLFPFTFLYSLAVRLKNHLYDIGYTRSFTFDIPVIVVGNLSVGGTGKSPMVEYLVRLLIGTYSIAILSRGYKRKTKGFRIAGEKDHAATIGDEPMQYYSKWNREITVAVGEDRAEAIPEILFQKPETQVILMDDGFQHRAVTPHLALLLTAYNKLFYKDYLLPGGWLREPRKEARRANIIVVTRCPPQIDVTERKEIVRNISVYASTTVPVFFTYLTYEQPVGIFSDLNPENFDHVFLFSGIADPAPFHDFAHTRWNVYGVKVYKDHHTYTSRDVSDIADMIQGSGHKKKMLLTTEKDAVKLKNNPEMALLHDLPVFYLPVRMVFIDNGPEFEQLILEQIQSATKK